MSDLEKSILKTVAFFDIFKHPLTAWEIHKWLYKYPGHLDFSQLLSVLAQSRVLAEEFSLTEVFYSLRGREFTTWHRKQNNNLADRKFARALKLVKLYRFIPYIKMVAVCNSLAYSNARDDSDIDLFIITQRRKIWLARFFAIILVRLVGFRPSPQHSRDAYCLSFFVDEDHLDISGVSLGKNDIYLAYWVKELMPLYDPDALYEKFLQANHWAQDYLPRSYLNQFVREVKDSGWSRVLAWMVGFISSPPLPTPWLDGFYRGLQLKIIDSHLKSMVNVDTRVVVNERMLKFHYNDRREHYYKKWKESVYKLLDKYERSSATGV